MMTKPKNATERMHPPNLEATPKTNLEADEIELQGQRLNGTVIEPAKYRLLDITDCYLEDAIVNNAVCFRAGIIRSQFKRAQMTGLQLAEGNIKDVSFTNCRINLSNFRNANFERCIFKDCDLTEADFAMAKLDFVEFDGCNLDQTEFSNSRCKEVKFIDTTLTTVKGGASLRGCTVSSQNLIELSPQLAQAAGITVED